MIPEGLRQDAFLGGRLQITQPARGYRAGMDPVLLAASCRAEPGQRVLDIGCGVGTAALCLGARVAGLQLCGVELQPDLADLARANGVANGQRLEVITGDATRLPAEMRARSFEHVLLNPPYFDRAQGSRGPDTPRETAMGEDTPLRELVRAGVRRLVPRGQITVVHRAERLADLLSAITAAGCGGITVLPLLPRAGRPARLILLRATKGARSPLTLAAPVILHDGAQHGVDGKDFTPEIAAVLRDGTPMPGWP